MCVHRNVCVCVCVYISFVDQRLSLRRLNDESNGVDKVTMIVDRLEIRVRSSDLKAHRNVCLCVCVYIS